MDISLDTAQVKNVQHAATSFIDACKRLFKDMSDAVVGTVADMYATDEQEEDPDRTARVLLKGNRHMYIALTLILLLTLYTVLFQS